MLLTMYKVPHAQYANYTDEGTEKADDSQSVKCVELSRITPPTHDPQVKGQLSWSQGAFLEQEALPW